MSMYKVGDKVLVNHATVDGLRETVTITAVDEERGNEFYWAGKRGLFPQDIWCISNPAAYNIREPDEPDPVNHPAHYGGDTTYEAIKVITAWELGFDLGNVTKYVARAGKKDPSKELEDLRKARFYLEHRINQLEQI